MLNRKQRPNVLTVGAQKKVETGSYFSFYFFSLAEANYTKNQFCKPEVRRAKGRLIACNYTKLIFCLLRRNRYVAI